MKKYFCFMPILVSLMVSNICFGQHLRTKEQIEDDLFNSQSENQSNTANASSKDQVSDDSSEKQDQMAMNYFDRIKKDTSKKDYSWIATQFHYPICVEADCREFRVNSPKELLKYKDQIFTTNIVQAILTQNRDQLFSKYDSYMIGEGEIWFETGYLHGITNNEGYSVVQCSEVPLVPLLKKYYGTWEAYRDRNGINSEVPIPPSKSKTIQILNDSFINNTQWLEPSMNGVEWIMETVSGNPDDIADKGSLLWEGYPEAFPNKIITVYACSGGQKHLYLEITSQGELAYYYSGEFIFFRKVK